MILYQNCENYSSAVIFGLCPGAPYFKIFKNLLVTKHKVGSIHILFETSLGDPLPKLLKSFPWGHIWALPRHTLFYIEI